MPRPPRTEYTPQALLQSVMAAVLSRSALQALLIGAPRLWPEPEGSRPSYAVAAALSPYRQSLWWRRMAVVLLRFALIALTYVLVTLLIRLFPVPGLPLAACWGPAALLGTLGVYLAVVQRPTLMETAQLLDRWYRLHDGLGTALELSSDPRGALQERQVELALARLRQLPDRAWSAARLGQTEGKAILALLAAVASAVLLAPSMQRQALSRPAFPPAAHATATPPALAVAHIAVGAQPARSLASLAPAPERTSSGTVPKAASFAASLQMRAGPQGQPGSAPPRAVPVPGALQATLGGGQTGRSQNPAAAGPSGAPRAGPATKGQAGQGDGPAGQPQSNNGQTGSTPQTGARGSAGSSQLKASAGQQDPTTSGNQNQQLGNPPASSGPQGQSGPGSGNPGANPFGQDPRAPTSRGPGKRSPGAAPSRSAGTHTAGRPAGSGPGHGPGPGGNLDSLHGNQDPSNLQRRGRDGAGADAGQRPPTRSGQAGAASGATVDLGGHFVLGDNPQDTRPVHVRPLASGPGSGFDGAAQATSSAVQGFVPEDASHLTPEEQAVVRAFFSAGANQ